MGDVMTAGELLRAARVSRGRSQKWLALRVGVSQAHVCDIEHGRRSILPASALAMSEALHMRPTEILVAAIWQDGCARIPATTEPQARTLAVLAECWSAMSESGLDEIAAIAARYRK